jgi:hypothetical protein
MLSVAKAKHVCNGKWKYLRTWFTVAVGNYDTSYQATIKFTFPKFSTSRILQWELYLVSKKEAQGTGYDIGIGCNLLMSAIFLDSVHAIIMWKDAMHP